MDASVPDGGEHRVDPYGKSVALQRQDLPEDERLRDPGKHLRDIAQGSCLSEPAWLDSRGRDTIPRDVLLDDVRDHLRLGIRHGPALTHAGESAVSGFDHR